VPEHGASVVDCGWTCKTAAMHRMGRRKADLQDSEAGPNPDLVTRKTRRPNRL